MKATRYPMVSPQLRDGTPLPPWVSPCSGMVCSGRRSPPCPFQTGVVQRSPLARRGDVAPTATGFGAPPPYVRPLILGWPKRAKNRQFLTPCGAKSWGSGGAPPTNLILLRNQCAPSTLSVACPRAPARRSRGVRGGWRGAFRVPVRRWGWWMGVVGLVPTHPARPPEVLRSQSECRPAEGTCQLRLRKLRLRPRFARLPAVAWSMDPAIASIALTRSAAIIDLSIVGMIALRASLL